MVEKDCPAGVKTIELIDGGGREAEFWQWCNRKKLEPEDVLFILRSVKLVEFTHASRLFTIPTEELVKELHDRDYYR